MYSTVELDTFPALNLFQRVTNPRFVVTVRVSTVGWQGCMSPVSRYQYGFVRCEAAKSVL